MRMTLMEGLHCPKSNYHLKTDAGSMLLILRKAKEAPPNEMSAIVENIPKINNGEKLNIKPDFATPVLKPSNKSMPIVKPTMANKMAWVNIKPRTKPLPAPIAFRVP